MTQTAASRTVGTLLSEGYVRIVSAIGGTQSRISLSGGGT
jgi:hypothetical protein